MLLQQLRGFDEIAFSHNCSRLPNIAQVSPKFLFRENKSPARASTLTVTVTEAVITLVGTGRPIMRLRHPSRSLTMPCGPGPSRCRSVATPGSNVEGHRPGVYQEVLGPPGWSSTRSSVAPPTPAGQGVWAHHPPPLIIATHIPPSCPQVARVCLSL